MKKPQSNAELPNEIVQQSLGHGIELLSHIELMEAQNTGGVNERLAKAGLQNPAIAIRNAVMTRIVLMVAREFSEPRVADRNLHRAVDLLSDPTVKIFNKNAKAKTETHLKNAKATTASMRFGTFEINTLPISANQRRRRFRSTKIYSYLRRKRLRALI
jgi:hypothetical protein